MPSKMRIAVVVGRFPVLSEAFILNQITGLIDRGHDVSILAERRGEEGVTHADVARYGLLEQAHYYGPVPSHYLLRAARGIPLLFSTASRSLRVAMKSLDVFTYGRNAASLRMLYQARSFGGTGPYDIVACHFGHNGLMAARMREIGVLGGRLVTSFHGSDFTRDLRAKGDRVYDRLFERGDLFLAVSQYCRDTLIRLGCDEGRTAVHHMGVDCRALAFHSVEPPTRGPVRILTVGRLVEKKGVEYGIRAVAKVISRRPDIEYSIIGDGPLRSRCDSLIQELAAADRIHLLGRKDPQETHRELRNSHLFLCPSVTGSDGDQEGIPVSLMEAMAVGLPVVSTRHSGIPELVQDGRSGFLVAERDVGALADRLLHLLEHPEIWSEMGRAGREHVERDHDIERLNDRLVDLYRGLL